MYVACIQPINEAWLLGTSHILVEELLKSQIDADDVQFCRNGVVIGRHSNTKKTVLVLRRVYCVWDVYLLYFLSCTKSRSGVAKSIPLLYYCTIWFRCPSLAEPPAQRPCEQNYMHSATKAAGILTLYTWLQVNETQNDMAITSTEQASAGWFTDKPLSARKMDPSDPSSLQARWSWARTHRKRIAPSSSKSHGPSPSAPQGPGDNEIIENSCHDKSLVTWFRMSKSKRMSQHSYENVCKTL